MCFCVQWVSGGVNSVLLGNWGWSGALTACAVACVVLSTWKRAATARRVRLAARARPKGRYITRDKLFYIADTLSTLPTPIPYLEGAPPTSECDWTVLMRLDTFLEPHVNDTPHTVPSTPRPDPRITYLSYPRVQNSKCAIEIDFFRAT